MWRLLEAVGNDNAQGEYYLPDVATGAIAEGARVVVIETDAAEVAGVNSRAELAAMEADWQAWRRPAAMDEGATLIAPATIWFAWDTRPGRDVTIEPHLFFCPAVSVSLVVRTLAHCLNTGPDLAAGGDRRLITT